MPTTTKEIVDIMKIETGEIMARTSYEDGVLYMITWYYPNDSGLGIYVEKVSLDGYGYAASKLHEMWRIGYLSKMIEEIEESEVETFEMVDHAENYSEKLNCEEYRDNG